MPAARSRSAPPKVFTAFTLSPDANRVNVGPDVGLLLTFDDGIAVQVCQAPDPPWPVVLEAAPQHSNTMSPQGRADRVAGKAGVLPSLELELDFLTPINPFAGLWRKPVSHGCAHSSNLSSPTRRCAVSSLKGSEGLVSVVKINQRPRRGAQQLFTIEQIGLNNLICQCVSFRNEPGATGDVIPPFLL